MSARIDTLGRRVVLTEATRPEVRKAIVGVAEDLMNRCLGREAAVELVRKALTSIGEEGFQIRTDGPLAVRIDQKDEVLRHVDAGCFVYSTMGRTAEGVPVYYVSGR